MPGDAQSLGALGSFGDRGLLLSPGGGDGGFLPLCCELFFFFLP